MIVFGGGGFRVLVISVFFAWPFAHASEITDPDTSAKGSFRASVQLRTEIMPGDSNLGSMIRDSGIGQTVIARCAGEPEKEFAMRSAAFFIDDGNYPAAMKILLAARVTASNDTVNFLLARCFEKMGDINYALGANYEISDSGGPLWPMALYQRASLLYMIGLNGKGRETARMVVTAYRKSTGADSCRGLLRRHERNVLIPILRVKSYAAYAFRNYRNDTNPATAVPGIISAADTTIASGNGFIKPSLSWPVLETGHFQCLFEPCFEVRLPSTLPQREQYGYGAEINCSDSRGTSNLKYGLAAKRAYYNRTGPIDTYQAYGFFVNSTGGGRSLLLLASGAAQRSQSSFLNGNYANVVAEERSALTLGGRIAFHPGIMTLRTGFRDIDNRFVPWMIAVSGASENSNVHQATYYQDTTFTTAIPVNGFKGNSAEVLLPYARPVQAFSAGSYSASTYYSFGLTNTVEFMLRSLLSLNLKTGYTVSWYPHPYFWDNAASDPSDNEALGLVFFNRDDGGYYYTGSLASGTFHRYRQWKKTRVDHKFMCGIGVEYMIRPLGMFYAQGSVSINRSSIPPSALYNFNYVEVMPRLDWMVEW